VGRPNCAPEHGDVDRAVFARVDDYSFGGWQHISAYREFTLHHLYVTPITLSSRHHGGVGLGE
jgi:hypothetical protein